MNKRGAILTGLTGLAALAATVASGGPKPNVVFILADDLGYGDISALNPGSKIRTPNLDALGRGGILFTDAHAASSLSTPSRYAIMTGRYSWRTQLKEGVYNGYSGPMIGEGGGDRKDLISLSGRGYFALREGDLKLVFWGGEANQSAMQLYDLSRDAAERTNLIDDPQYRETVGELTSRMRRYVDEGRSTPGKPQKNDTDNHWKQTTLF